MGTRYLLATNICIYIAKHNPSAVRERFARHAASELCSAPRGRLENITAKFAQLCKVTGRSSATATFVAAHARSEGWIFVTNNEREFIRVEGLQIENWVEPERL